MEEEVSGGDFEDRLRLIERMLAEGRRTTERWAWAFVLWGVAYFVAMAWGAWWPNGAWAWPVTMVAASIATGLLAVRKPRYAAQTAIGRALGAVWVSTGIAMFALLGSLGLSGRFEWHVFVAAVAAMLGIANAASGMILKWRLQSLCAAAWWVTAVAACFVSEAHATVVFLVATFFCQIAFGVYGMIAESRDVERDGFRA
jgi:hypothetical protein